MYLITVPYQKWCFEDAIKSYCGTNSTAFRSLSKDLEAIIGSDNIKTQARNKAREYLKNWKTLAATNKDEEDESSDVLKNTRKNNALCVNNLNNYGKSTIVQNNSYSLSEVASNKKRKSNTMDCHLDYLVGGEGEVVISEFTNNWVFNDVNISSLFHFFRNKAVKIIERIGRPQNSVEELAINGILYLDNDLSFIYDIDQLCWDQILIEVHRQFQIADDKTLNLSISRITEISKKARSNAKDSIDSAIRWLYEAEQERSSAKATVDICFNMAKIKSEHLREHLFSSMIVEPIICSFLPSDSKYTYMKGNSEQLPESKGRRGSHGRVPDLSLSVTVNGLKVTLFLCEIKSPSFMKTTKEEDPGFIKLANEMKDELDLMMRQVENNNVAIFGLLVQGYKCRLFRMDLQYHKLYRLIIASQFYLPRNRHDLDCLSGCVEALSSLKINLRNSISSTLKLFFDRNVSSAPSSSSSLEPENNPLESYHSPQ